MITGRMRVTAAKVALWVQTEGDPEGRGHLVIFDDFKGNLAVHFNLGEMVDAEGWIHAVRLPGGSLELHGTWRRYVKAGWVDPNALEEGR